MGAACCGPERDDEHNRNLTDDQKVEWQKKKKEVNMVACIVRIQSAFRGYLARRRVRRIRTEREYMTLRQSRGDAAKIRVLLFNPKGNRRALRPICVPGR